MALWKQFVHLTLFRVVSNWAFFALLCDVMSHTILPLTKAGGLWTICKIFSKIGALNQKKSKNADVNPPERRVHFNKGDTFLGSLELGTFCYIISCYVTKLKSTGSRKYIFCPCNPLQALDCLHTTDSCIFFNLCSIIRVVHLIFPWYRFFRVGYFLQDYVMLRHEAELYYLPYLHFAYVTPCKPWMDISFTLCSILPVVQLIFFEYRFLWIWWFYLQCYVMLCHIAELYQLPCRNFASVTHCKPWMASIQQTVAFCFLFVAFCELCS